MFIPDPDFPPILDPDPGSRGQKSTGSRIRNTVKMLNFYFYFYLAGRFMKLPGKQKRGGKRRRSASPGDEVEGCDNPAFQASMLEVAVGEGDINASLSVESPPPIPPPRYRNKPPCIVTLCVYTSVVDPDPH
jgi:hypothetical protein